MNHMPEAYTGEKDYIFISYSHDEKLRDISEEVISALAKRFNIFYDEGFQNEDWIECFVDCMRDNKCRQLIVLFSKEASESKAIKREVEYYLDNAKRFNMVYEKPIVIKLDNYNYRECKWADFCFNGLLPFDIKDYPNARAMVEAIAKKMRLLECCHSDDYSRSIGIEVPPEEKTNKPYNVINTLEYDPNLEVPELIEVCKYINKVFRDNKIEGNAEYNRYSKTNKAQVFHYKLSNKIGDNIRQICDNHDFLNKLSAINKLLQEKRISINRVTASEITNYITVFYVDEETLKSKAPKGETKPDNYLLVKQFIHNYDYVYRVQLVQFASSHSINATELEKIIKKMEAEGLILSTADGTRFKVLKH